MTKLPYIQFYQGDWKKDLGVQCVSFAARGLWVEMLFLMQDSSERGVLVDDSQRPIPDTTLCRLCKADPAEFTELLAELENAAVFSRREDGAIYCRRMVREAAADSMACPGKIYFIYAPKSNSVKIGYTAGSVEKRMAVIQTSSPEPLELLGVLPGGESKEAEFHKMFSHLRMSGEWFRACPEITAVAKGRQIAYA